MTATRSRDTIRRRRPLLALAAMLAVGACTEPAPVVEIGKEIHLEYSAKTADGAEVDANPDGKPIVFVVGADMLQPKVEAELIGMRKGDGKTFAVPEAYGTYDASRSGLLPKEALPADTKVGDQVQMADGVPASVKELRDDMVVLDLNHPLAGKEITFEVRVVEIGQPKTPKKDG